MVNILIPTDFSELSKVAVQYGVKLANKLDGNVTLLHVINMVQPTRASMRLRYKALELDLVEFAEEDFRALVEEAQKSSKTAHRIKHKVEKGQSFNDTVKRFAKKHRTGLIVMGTKGASGLKKYVIGSNTASLLEISHVPVLVVPEKAEFKTLKNVVYASNLKHIDKELKALIPYVTQFDAHLHILHVMPVGGDMEAAKAAIAKAWKKVGYKRITVSIKEGTEIERVIENYVKQTSADMVTLFSAQHGFFDKLFNRSITRKLAFQSKVPLLAFRLKN